MTESSQNPSSVKMHWLTQAAPILAGCGAGLAYLDDRLGWLAWIVLIPIGWVWSDRARQTPSLAAIFCGGLIYHGLALNWLRTCYSDGTEWFGPRATAWFVISAICAAVFVVMWFYGQFLVRKVNLPVTLALPIAWVSMEFAKQYAGLIFVQMEFPWTKLGLTQAAWTPMAQVADLGGEPLLSFLVCVANGAIVDALDLLSGTTRLPAKRSACGVIAGATCMLATWFYGEWRLYQSTGDPGPIISLMGELDLPPYLDAEQVPQLTGSSTDAKPHLLLWSELAWHHKLVETSPITPVGLSPPLPPNANLLSLGPLDDYQQFVEEGLLKSATAVDGVLVLGCERLEQTRGGWRRFNSVVCVNPTSQSIATYDKQRLVPWAEYLPFATSESREAYFAPGIRQPVFQLPISIDSEPQRLYNFQMSTCYDLCFSRHFRQVFRNPSSPCIDFLVHCGSEGQDPTGALASVLLKTAQVRAIENRRAIVRNVNFGYSGAIDSNGQILHKTQRVPIQQPVTLSPLPIDNRFSAFDLWGDWPLGILCVVAGLASYRKKMQTYGE